MGVVELSKEFRFEAAHRLTKVPPGHKCGRLHGHSWIVRVKVEGEVDPDSGWYRDFADISTAMKPIIAALDHSYLNEIEGLENPTSEVLAAWIWQRLASSLPGLYEIEVQETAKCICRYRGES